MNTVNRRHSLKWLAAAAVAAGLAACGGSDPGPSMNVTADGLSTFNTEALAAALAAYPLETLSTAEADSLAFMREEEMLAQAVYTASARTWPTSPIFGNIASSEASHTAAVKRLLDRYGLSDPMAGLPLGTFATPAFQDLYDALVAASNVSLIEALKVGVQIEELDMRDIEAQKSSIDNADILYVYDNLLRGSRNHLRAFWKVLTSLGGTYVPQYISQALFDQIVNSPMESGR